MIFQVRLFYEVGVDDPVEILEIDVDSDLEAISKADDIADVFGARYALVDRKKIDPVYSSP